MLTAGYKTFNVCLTELNERWPEQTCSVARMADNKRQSTSGKVPVATPNIGPSGMVSLETALGAALGSK